MTYFSRACGKEEHRGKSMRQSKVTYLMAREKKKRERRKKLETHYSLQVHTTNDLRPLTRPVSYRRYPSQ
jgi:hypothetical protein